MFQTGSMYYNFSYQVVVESNECINLFQLSGKEEVGFLRIVNIGLWVLSSKLN